MAAFSAGKIAPHSEVLGGHLAAEPRTTHGVYAAGLTGAINGVWPRRARF